MKRITPSVVRLSLIILAWMSCLPVNAGSVQAYRDNTPTVLVGIAPNASGETAKLIQDSIYEMSKKLPGTKIRVFDAMQQRLITEYEVPVGKLTRIKLRELNRQAHEVTKYLGKNQAVRAGQGLNVHPPAFFDMAASSMRSSGGATQIILYGSTFFRSDRDPAENFEPGEYPSDGYFKLTSRESALGTVDRQGTLNGCVVHWCTLGETPSTVEQAAATRFWALYLDQLDATLSTIENYPTVVIERVAEGASGPILRNESIRDEPAKILRVGEEPQPKPIIPPTPDFDPEPVTNEHVQTKSGVITLTSTNRKVDTMFNVDGSSSMSHVMPDAKRVVKRSSEYGVRLTEGFAFGIHVYRLPELASKFALSERKQKPENTEYLVVDAWEFFLSTHRFHFKGEEYACFDHVPTAADVEGGIRSSLWQLAHGDGDTKLLVCIGDRGPFEMDGELNGISDQDRRAKDRTLSMVRQFRETHDDLRIVAMFTGDPNGNEVDRASAEFFEELAALGAEHSVYTENFFELEKRVAEAILND